MKHHAWDPKGEAGRLRTRCTACGTVRERQGVLGHVLYRDRAGAFMGSVAPTCPPAAAAGDTEERADDPEDLDQLLADPLDAAALGLVGVLRTLGERVATGVLMHAVLAGPGAVAVASIATAGRDLGAHLEGTLPAAVREHVVAAGAALARAAGATGPGPRDQQLAEVATCARAALAAAGAAR